MSKRVKSGTKSAVRKTLRILKLVERSNDVLLGSIESAARIRRYVAAHEPPPDDNSAFRTLCSLIFAQGLGFEAVDHHREELHAAFASFAVEAVARLDAASVGHLLSSPVTRNAEKIEACLQIAGRWCEVAANGTYMSRLAQVAADDDTSTGWPKLLIMLREDFPGLPEAMAPMLLKRWGFFTSVAHPGARRLLVRLGLLDGASDGPSVQLFLGFLAEASGCDPYAVEAALALFAGMGPCRPDPRCAECALSESCAYAADLVAAT